MTCPHPDCNGRHANGIPIVRLCPAAQERRRVYRRRWEREQRQLMAARTPDDLEVALPEGTCILCSQPIEGGGTCAECRAELAPPRRKRVRGDRSAESARRAELRRDPAYRCHQELLRRQRLRRNKTQLATVG